MPSLAHAKITPRRSSARGHADHGWLSTYHTFSFATYHAPAFLSFGSLRVLNEDRVAPGTGFPTHTHRDAEIFSYILRGELTHRDSTLAATDGNTDACARLTRGDVQFTTGGRGIAHSETNESTEAVHFLQIWATPWARGLAPRYHVRQSAEAAKRVAFVAVLSPLKAGPGAGAEEEEAAVPVLEGTIPVHADLVMGAGIVGVGRRFEWGVGGGEGVVRQREGRRVYVHVAMTGGGKARVRLDGREGVVLEEGDGAFVEGVGVGDGLGVESVGEVEAEVVVLDSD